MADLRPDDLLAALDDFPRRHIGPDAGAVERMLAQLGVPDLATLIAEAVPPTIRTDRALALPPALGEAATLDRLAALAAENQVFRSLIGLGYHDCVTPPVIQRNILENPGWYTQYTPYQPEIAQGRLEALVNFQTVVAELTALPIANASLLDEATAAAEAMVMCRSMASGGRDTFFVADDCHPQTIAVVQTRAKPLGIQVRVAPIAAFTADDTGVFGVLVQTPDTFGRLHDLTAFAKTVHAAGAELAVATDLLALTLMTPPGEMGADIVLGSSQRFGVPLGFGGPHAAFLSAREAYARTIPGRIVGVSRDATGEPAYRLALQTREQHIRRERATSNICTAQVLLAVMAGMYAVYHGPDGLKRIAGRVHRATVALARGLERLGFSVGDAPFFDTLRVEVADPAAVLAAARAARVNLRPLPGAVGISLDETVSTALLDTLLGVFAAGKAAPAAADLVPAEGPAWPATLVRQGPFLTHPVFHSYHGEHAFLRYVRRLESRDLSLTTSMIPLGSCTMKLNATTEMVPVTWKAFGGLHPFAPADQTRGYQQLFTELEAWLADITGFAAVSLQPNAGSQGEYAGLLVIRAWHAARGQGHRDVCLIPTSAHGTNPASAVMAGLRVVAVACNDRGDVDLADLQAKAEKHRDQLAALMITYPSTHGVFEEGIRQITGIIHENGGQVYLDGANMNASVGLVRPGELGADVCHLNLHKTFCIPHGGGGPGMGPIAVARHLAPHLPGHPVSGLGGEGSIGPVSAAPFGSPGILPIPYAYIRMMGAEGLKHATEVAILNANYMASRLAGHYDVLFHGANGRVAHEFVLDCRGFKQSAGIGVDDIAKRLMDFGFHAPTMSWPVPGTLMIEPTESEPLAELDRFCDAMIAIRAEIRAIEEGQADRTDNPLRNAPHTAAMVTADAWAHPYSRAQAAFPVAWLRGRKFWPASARVDNAYGDRNLQCLCPPVEELAEG
ncbi:MAG: aminomethyl-transferring glycine dehydrogenase [Myxococcales bacterium]|nr:aminomethyl-transferring glycine dehydrogenase [Myxococcales bacterium]